MFAVLFVKSSGCLHICSEILKSAAIGVYTHQRGPQYSLRILTLWATLQSEKAFFACCRGPSFNRNSLPVCYVILTTWFRIFP